MAYATEPCFVADMSNGFTEEILKHPVMPFMQAYDKAFCVTKSMFTGPYTDWFTPDFEFVDGSSVILHGADAWAKISGMFVLLSDWFVEPEFGIVRKEEGGEYMSIGEGKIYGNFKVPGEKLAKDKRGVEWEFCVSDFSLIS
jgi:hypothetical protein